MCSPSYQLSFDDAFALVGLASQEGVEFTDETIFSNKAASEAEYGVEGVMQEVLANTFMDIVWSAQSKVDLTDLLA